MLPSLGGYAAVWTALGVDTCGGSLIISWWCVCLGSPLVLLEFDTNKHFSFLVDSDIVVPFQGLDKILSMNVSSELDVKVVNY